MKISAIILLLAAAGAVHAGGPVRYNLSAGFVLDDNVTRGSRGRDIEDDSYLAVEGTASYSMPINRDSFVAFKGLLNTSRYQTFDKLSSNHLQLEASYHIRPSQGFTATGYFVSAAYEKRMFDSDQREGSATRLGFGLHKRLSELLALRAGFISETIDAASVVFDADNQRLYLDLEWLLNASNTLYVTLSRFDGNIVATTIPEANIIATSLAIVRDDAFTDLSPNRFAYKLDVSANGIKLGNAWAIDSRQGLDVSVYYYNASAYRDYSYTIISLYYSYAF